MGFQPSGKDKKKHNWLYMGRTTDGVEVSFCDRPSCELYKIDSKLLSKAQFNKLYTEVSYGEEPGKAVLFQGIFPVDTIDPAQIKAIVPDKNPNGTEKKLLSEKEVQKIFALVYTKVLEPNIAGGSNPSMTWRETWEFREAPQSRIVLKVFGTGRKQYGYTGPASYAAIKAVVVRESKVPRLFSSLFDTNEETLISRSVTVKTVTQIGERFLEVVSFFEKAVVEDDKALAVEKQKATDLVATLEEIRQGVNWIEVKSEDGNTFDLTIKGAFKGQAIEMVKLLKYRAKEESKT